MSCKEQKVYPPLSPYEKKALIPGLFSYISFLLFIITEKLFLIGYIVTQVFQNVSIHYHLYL